MIRQRTETLVVVGAGLVGARVVEEVLARDPERFQIRMFGAEPHGTYNRILLSSVLGGFEDPARLWVRPLSWYEQAGVRVHVGVRAEAIDRDRRVVVGGGGKVEEPYDHLILATGSRPLVPSLSGVDLRGVFVFRTLDDCKKIAGWAEESSRAVVMGGGLLGLEAARGLLSHDLDVTVVELGPRLMPQQLDEVGAELLRRKLEGMGVRVLLGRKAEEVVGDNGRVIGLRLEGGETLPADMVVLSCGIRPNVEEARASGLAVDRGILVDDQLRASDPAVFAVGECAQHRGRTYGVVEPLFEQARVLADVVTGARPDAAYTGSRLVTTLKVMGVSLTAMGEPQTVEPGCEVVSHLDPDGGIYRKLVLRERQIVGAILLGTGDTAGRLEQHFRTGRPLVQSPFSLLGGGTASEEISARDLPDEMQICNCNAVLKRDVVAAIRAGKTSIEALGEATRAGTGCGSCQPLLGQLLECHGQAAVKTKNKVEVMKAGRDGLDSLDDVLRLAASGRWQEMTEDDKQRAKWLGLFFRKQTPGHFMLRIRSTGGRLTARQVREVADLSDEYGKGFCDLTTRQQVQMRWLTIADVPEVWRRLDAVGLTSKQTGMDNVRGVCGCPVAGLTPHELLDASPAAQELTRLILDNRDFTNLPRKLNITITGCLESCCHTETQDIALVPSYRELEGEQVNGFNIFVGGKQGSGGYLPARPLDVFVRPGEAAAVAAEVIRIFRDHGARDLRTRARLAFLVEQRGIGWLRGELERRSGRVLHRAGPEMRKKHHADHLGIHPQKPAAGTPLFYVGVLVPVGRITTAQLREVASVAECYGSGEVRLTAQQNLVIPGVPEGRLGALTQEPIFRELPFEPGPLERGLVSCVGSDYCHFALIETKGWALKTARALEERLRGRKIQPLTVHWSGCPAGCGLHQVATIGLQGCRSRVGGEVVDAAHVYINGRSGPDPRSATDVMYDVPCDQLPEALEPLVAFLPR